MKKTLIIPLVFIVSAAFSQTKKLPPKITIVLTDKEYIAFYQKVDSLMAITSTTSNSPATFINPFLQRFANAWIEIDKKVARQMITDTTKSKK